MGSITATVALLVKEEDFVVNDREKLLLNDVGFGRTQCPGRRGRNVLREIIQAFMKERGEKCKLIKERNRYSGWMRYYKITISIEP